MMSMLEQLDVCRRLSSGHGFVSAVHLSNAMTHIDAQQARIADLELALFAENQKQQEVEQQRDQLAAIEGSATQLSGNSGELPAVVVPDATKLTRYSSTTLRGGISDMEPNPHGAYVKLADVNAMLAAAEKPACETCENGQPDCGPVAHHDIEGVPLCDRCFDLEDDAPNPKGGE